MKKPRTTTPPPWRAADKPTLVMKLTGDSSLGFSSPYWTDSRLLNDNSPGFLPGDAKYAEYLSKSFDEIMVCIGAPDSNCVTHTFKKRYKNAKELFSSGYIRDTSVDQKGIEKAFGSPKGKYKACPMQRPGFNIQCRDGNKARYGYCGNCASQACQNSDNNDADYAIGIGLRGQATPKEMGAGWTNYYASGAGTCSPNSMQSKEAWLYVCDKGSCKQEEVKATMKLIMKIDGNTFGFSSPYWNNNKLITKGGDAKYEPFLTAPFEEIMVCIDKPDSNCVVHRFKKTWKNAVELFSAGYTRDPTLDKRGIEKAFGAPKGRYRDCPMQRPGFNIQCNDGNKARYGYCGNCASQACQNSDNHDADYAIGIGLKGQSTPNEMGAGWTNYYASGAGTCSPNSMKNKKAWLYVCRTGGCNPAAVKR